MTTFFLIRHATNDWVGKAIAGRAPGVHLNSEGKKQATRLAEALAEKGIEIIFSSSMERALETAEPLSKKLGREIQIADEFNEIDFGNWTGKTLNELDPLPEWRRWNVFRSGTRIPNGEIVIEVQARMVKQIETIRAKYSRERIAIFSHGDPIKAALFYYLGLPLDSFQRIEISPASVSILQISDYGAQVIQLNDVVD